MYFKRVTAATLALFLLGSSTSIWANPLGGTATGSNPAAIAIDQPIKPKDYQAMLGKGMDVDWAKTSKGQRGYSQQMVADFKAAGLSHVRIRVKDRASDVLLAHLEKVVTDCLAAGLIPVIAYQGADFKAAPAADNLNGVVDWWVAVANRFKDYSHRLSFDLLIEVTEALNRQPDMLNQLYERTVTAIRPSNPTRIIFISPVLRSAPERLNDLKIPTAHGGYVMAEWHFYASGPDRNRESKKWTTGAEDEKELIRQKIREAVAWQQQTGVYTWVGAWMPGSYNKGNGYTVSEQVAFARFVTCELTKNYIPFAVNSDTKFYNSSSQRWIAPMRPVLDVILQTSCK